MRVQLTATANPAATGIDRYARALPAALRAQGVDVEAVGFARRELKVGPLRVGGLLSVQAARLRPHARPEADLVHALDPSAAVRGTDVVTVHDILPETRPGPWPVRMDWAVVRAVARRARTLICISDVTRKEVAARWSIPEDRLVTVHQGVDHARFRPVAGGAPLPQDDVPTFLFVGDDHPRKNLLLAVQALARVQARGRRVRLARAGPVRHPAQTARVQAAARDAKVDLVDLGFLDDEALARAYSAATAFLWPSLAEGFGFPLVEAMACGAPVVALDTPINREVGGAPARYHSSDPEDAARAIEDVLDRPPARDALRAHARTFSWERTARETIAVYERVRAA